MAARYVVERQDLDKEFSGFQCASFRSIVRWQCHKDYIVLCDPLFGAYEEQVERLRNPAWRTEAYKKEIKQLPLECMPRRASELVLRQ